MAILTNTMPTTLGVNLDEFFLYNSTKMNIKILFFGPLTLFFQKKIIFRQKMLILWNIASIFYENYIFFAFLMIIIKIVILLNQI